MKPYWVSLVNAPFGLERGLGITAIDEADVRRLAGEAAGRDVALESIRWIRDAAELDVNHVVPSMGNLLRHGMWFLRGFEHLT